MAIRTGRGGNKSDAHDRLEKELMDHLQKAFGLQIFLERRPVKNLAFMGVAMKFGITGQCDISGAVFPGFRLEIEVKTGQGKRTPEQIVWARRMVEIGAIYVLAHALTPEDNDNVCRQTEQAIREAVLARQDGGA